VAISSDPHVILGVEPGASRAAIKAAWRRLARQHHPDLVGGDAEARARATRRMAEINAAYETLLATAGEGLAAGVGLARRNGGPPPPPPTRPVTARVDTSRTFRPRNATITPPGVAAHPPGQPPPPRILDRLPLRASPPNGPVERRRHRAGPAIRPSLPDALATTVAFGKFSGRTLAEIAAREPSYIDWLAAALCRDWDLVLAARVVQEELDRRRVIRRRRINPTAPRHPFQLPI
jgi:hypothetical protein